VAIIAPFYNVPKFKAKPKYFFVFPPQYDSRKRLELFHFFRRLHRFVQYVCVSVQTSPI
jgi:hypothetical protein